MNGHDYDKLKAAVFSVDKTTLQLLYLSKQIDRETAEMILRQNYVEHFESQSATVEYYQDIISGSGSTLSLFEKEYNECTVKSLLNGNTRYNKRRDKLFSFLSSEIQTRTIEQKQLRLNGKSLRVTYYNSTWSPRRRDDLLPYDAFVKSLYIDYLTILHQVLNETSN